MTQYVLKIALTAIVIVAVSEISKRSTFLGGLLASLPIISLMAMIWLYVETRDVAKVASLSTNIFWLALPSLLFFLALPPLLRKLSFPASLTVALAIMLAGYATLVFTMKKLGVATSV